MSECLQEKGYVIVSGGTDSHLFLIDLSAREMTGLDAQLALDKARITTNRNMIPFDERSPQLTSGVRIGTPAVTTRGMGTAEMIEIADMIARVLDHIGDDNIAGEVGEQVRELCKRFPIYMQNS